MTTPSDGDGDGVRHAAQTLRAASDALPGSADQLDTRVRGIVEGVAGDVETAARRLAAQSADARRELLESAHKIRLAGTRMAAAREDAFTEVGHLLAEYADDIGALLRPPGGEEPRVGSIRPPVPPQSVATTAGDAAAVRRRLPDTIAQRRAINQVVAQFPTDLQALARTLLLGRSSHAVQRHGHHLTPDRMIARLQWLLDPAGVDGWRLNSDGTAESWRPRGDGSHQVGASSGYYTSAEAVAKPLIALLGAAGATRTALDAFLDSNAGDATIIKVFLRTSDTGITAADVHTQRAPGTGTKDGKKMWQRARRGAMDGQGEVPGVREYDMVNHGKRPGSLIVFARQPGESWRLITSYFADDPHRVEYMEL